jgi:hypothetical protein
MDRGRYRRACELDAAIRLGHGARARSARVFIRRAGVPAPPDAGPARCARTRTRDVLTMQEPELAIIDAEP